MRVSFVFPPFYLESLYNLPPLGLISLATALGEDGADCRIHDFVLELREATIPMGPGVYEACARRVLEAAPDLAAFSAQCATYPAVLRIAEIVKRENPDVTVLLGGHNASFVDRATLDNFSFIDMVARGEGEATMRELARTMQDGEDLAGVAGLTFRRGGEIVANPDRELIADLDSLPRPDYGYAAPLERYKAACGLPRAIAILDIGRGCPHACVYCSESALWRRRCRTYSVERIVSEMRRLRDVCGAEYFLLSYDQFTANRGFVTRFCERVIDEGLEDTPWYCISRLDTVDDELLSLMNRAGCDSMCYGIDSGSKRTLAFINKRIDQDILLDRVRATTDNGMHPTLSFIVGFPEEQRADIDATLELALRCGLLGNVSPLIQLPTVLPGSGLHAMFARDLVREVDTYFALGLEFDQGRRLAGDEALIASDPAMFSSFYNLPCRAAPLRELAKAAEIFPLIVSFFPKSYYLLCQALAASPFVLFLELAAHAAKASGRERFDLDAPRLRRRFPAFVRDAFTAAAPEGFAHLADVLRYELRCLDAAGPGAPGSAYPQGGAGGPGLAGGVIVDVFDYDLPRIIEDLRDGIVNANYPEAVSRLVFEHRDGQLEVSEVNAFGNDFLALCDGSTTVGQIARAMYASHGGGMEFAGFVEECERAARMFASMRIVSPAA
ncbi:MAG: radical SAM protein [Desulfovibrionaceae bacterium]|nr:radical SAM protein [Desulfovibrionaceae bacterium]MBF0512699.1 radical SAM protein [Desulfovibrionaceae bacterium]